MIPEDIYLKILRSAVKSPSGHNTQPWFLIKENDGICIKPDFSRALPIADPENRELYISLGCAAETAMIAAQFYGYKPEIQINNTNTGCVIKIAMQRDDTQIQPELFPYINKRQTTRNLFEPQEIPKQNLEELQKTAIDINLHFFIERTNIQQFAPFISQANDAQMNNPEFKKELIQWMRFSEKEAMQKGDGLYTACSGIPSMGRVLGSLVLRNAVTAKSENKRLLRQLENSSAIVLFTTPGDNTENRIKTGMAFQRFALTATKLNLSHSFLNSPCQISEVRDKMISGLDLKGEFPQLLIRLGYSEKMPYSLRRNTYRYAAH